jgi:16S rRNA (uracil1498-N3)-methyltransferase
MERSRKAPENLRSLPRVFVEGAALGKEIELPPEELSKFRKVLRLGLGSKVAVLPNDGSVLECSLTEKGALPLERFWPGSESRVRLTVAQSLPKGDKLEEIVRACTELGVDRFLLFPSERSVVVWDERKFQDKVRRLRTIAKEASELSFRTQIPEIEWRESLSRVLEDRPDAMVLSEKEGVERRLVRGADHPAIVVGPEGGWSPQEFERIADRGVTLGPRVLRVDHAAAAAASVLLIDSQDRV